MKQKTFRENIEDRLEFLQNILDNLSSPEDDLRINNIYREIENLNRKLEHEKNK